MEHEPQRREWEAEFERRLAKVRDKWHPLLMDAAGDPPNPNNIPEELWELLERDTRDETYWVFLTTFFHAYNLLHSEWGSPQFEPEGPVLPDQDELPGRGDIELPPASRREQELGREWAARKAEELASGMRATNQKRMSALRIADAQRRAQAQASGQPSPGQPNIRKEFQTALDDIFSGARHSRVAATEITDAISNGEGAVVARARRELGWEIVEVWRTERDLRVCPICRPLHGTTSDYYGPRLGAPPAHIACRCWIIYRVLKRGTTLPVQRSTFGAGDLSPVA